MRSVGVALAPPPRRNRRGRCSTTITWSALGRQWYFEPLMRSADRDSRAGPTAVAEGSPVRLACFVTDAVSTGLLRPQLQYMRDDGFGVPAIPSPGDRLERCFEKEGVRAVPVPMARLIAHNGTTDSRLAAIARGEEPLGRPLHGL